MKDDYFHDWCFKEIRRLSEQVDGKTEKLEIMPSLLGLIKICLDSDNPIIREKIDTILAKKPFLKKYLS